MTRVQTIVRAEAAQKVDWQQAAKDAGAKSLNDWIVEMLDQAAGSAQAGSEHAPAEPLQAPSTVTEPAQPYLESGDREMDNPGTALATAARQVREEQDLRGHFKPDPKR